MSFYKLHVVFAIDLEIRDITKEKVWEKAINAVKFLTHTISEKKSGKEIVLFDKPAHLSQLNFIVGSTKLKPSPTR